MRIADDDLERSRDFLARGAAAHVEKIRGLLAKQLDDVHGGHGEAGAVHHAADAAVELHIGKIVFRRFAFGRVLFVGIAQKRNVLVPEQCIVVEIDLGIETDHLAVPGDDEGIDLEQTHVPRGERIVQSFDDPAALFCAVAIKLQGRRNAAPDMRLIAGSLIDLERQDFLRSMLRDFFDIHAAFRRRDEGDTARRPIDERGKIEFASDRRALFDVKPPDDPSFLARLMGNERHAQHAPGLRAHFFDRADDLHAATFAAPAGMNLSLHDPGGTAQLFRRCNGFFDGECGQPARYGHAEAAQNFLGLVFVDVHGVWGYLLASHLYQRDPPVQTPILLRNLGRPACRGGRLGSRSTLRHHCRLGEKCTER